MTTPRIAPIEPPYSDTIQDAFDKIMPPGVAPLNIFRTFAHNPPILRKQMALGAQLLSGGGLPPLDRELVILRTCARCGSEYEWGVHVAAFARPLGMSEASIAGTVTATADSEVWNDRERALVRFVDQLHDTATLDDDAFADLASTFNEAEIVELITVCGMYHAISFATNALRMDLEETAERFPDSAPVG